MGAAGGTVGPAAADERKSNCSPFTKRPGRRAQVRFMPGCLVWSLLLSIGLTPLLNVAIRVF